MEILDFFWHDTPPLPWMYIVQCTHIVLPEFSIFYKNMVSWVKTQLPTTLGFQTDKKKWSKEEKNCVLTLIRINNKQKYV